MAPHIQPCPLCDEGEEDMKDKMGDAGDAGDMGDIKKGEEEEEEEEEKEEEFRMKRVLIPFVNSLFSRAFSIFAFTSASWYCLKSSCSHFSSHM